MAPSDRKVKTPLRAQSGRRGKRLLPVARILVATDFSPLAMKALDYAKGLAAKFSATVTVLHVVPPVLYVEPANSVELAREGEAKARKQLEKIEPRVDAVCVAHGNPVESIVRTAKKMRADLIVVGSRGLSSWKGWVLGSVAQRLLQTAPCPVLVVPRKVRAVWV